MNPRSTPHRPSFHWGTIAALVLGIAAVFLIVGGYLISDKMDRASDAAGMSTGQAHQAEPNTPADRTSTQKQQERQGSGISGNQTTNVPPASR
jgi:hypothetical protein